MSSIIYYHGDILTMEEEKVYPEAVFVKEGVIEKVGTLEEIEALREENTQMFDLKGNTLLPGFIDAHSHITALAKTLAYVNLADCQSIQQIIDKLKKYIETKEIKEGQWVIGVGYDHNFLKEKRHPDKIDLDKVSKTYPILISHISGHMGVVNTQGLNEMQINEYTKNPEGGSYGRMENSLEPNGYLEETVFLYQAKVVGTLSKQIQLTLLEEAQKIYLESGITTVQDGLTRQADFEILKEMAEEGKLGLDVVSYIDMGEKNSVIEKNRSYVKQYQHHLKIGGYKIVLDGSPQAKTAWLTNPYEGETSYRGYPSKTDEEVQAFVHEAMRKDRQLLAHCNGDAAAEQFIRMYEVEKKMQKEDIDIRPVMIHAQTVRKDQLEKMKQIGIIPSFFIAHIYYWGDIHIQNLGLQRASRISPAKEAVDLNMCFTFHQDTPVIQPNMLETIWCAVNRITKKGNILGKEQCIDVYDALKAVTIHAAYSYFEEKEKGSIKEGKKAQFVILNQNPLKIPKEQINKIKVMQTIIN
ncbi:MAG: amidohydrolase [Clostridia bacterium]